MDIKILITQMTELFIIIFLGYFIYKIKLIDDNFVKRFSKLILDVTMPAMILASVLQLEERQSVSDVLVALAVAAVLIFALLPVIGILLAKLLRVDRENIGLYTFMNTYSNVGFMGFPVISALCGSVGLFYAAIFNLIFNLGVYTMGAWMMKKGRSDTERVKPKQLLSPGVIVAACAIIIYFLNIHVPDIITETINSVGSITSPSAMILVGATLAKTDIKSVFGEWRLYPWTVLKQIAIPLLLWVPLTIVIKNPMLLTVTYILTAMPVANSAVLFATTYNCDEALAAKTIFLTTLFSLLTVPLCVITVM